MLLVVGISVGAKDRTLNQGYGMHLWTDCGTAFGATWHNDQLGSLPTELRSICQDQLAMWQPIAWGLIGLGAAAIVAAFLVASRRGRTIGRGAGVYR